MSVLIKGMEMPISCAECRLMADGWCYSVGFEQREKISTVKRPTWCPLVPVPPHGRLIDADSFLALINDSTILSDFLKCIINPLIRGEPTIIPAEEGERWLN